MKKLVSIVAVVSLGLAAGFVGSGAAPGDPPTLKADADLAQTIKGMIDARARITEAKLQALAADLEKLSKRVETLAAQPKVEAPKSATVDDPPKAPTVETAAPGGCGVGGCGASAGADDSAAAGRQRQPIRRILRFLFRGRRGGRGCR